MAECTIWYWTPSVMNRDENQRFRIWNTVETNDICKYTYVYTSGKDDFRFVQFKIRHKLYF